MKFRFLLVGFLIFLSSCTAGVGASYEIALEDILYKTTSIGNTQTNITKSIFTYKAVAFQEFSEDAENTLNGATLNLSQLKDRLESIDTMVNNFSEDNFLHCDFEDQYYLKFKPFMDEYTEYLRYLIDEILYNVLTEEEYLKLENDYNQYYIDFNRNWLELLNILYGCRYSSKFLILEEELY